VIFLILFFLFMHKWLANIKEYSQELSIEIKWEIAKSSHMLWFIWVLVFVGLGKAVWYSMQNKIILCLLLMTVICLVWFNLLGKWFIGHPPIWSIEDDLSITEYKSNYSVALQILREKILINKVSLVIILIVFFYMMILFFFVDV